MGAKRPTIGPPTENIFALKCPLRLAPALSMPKMFNEQNHQTNAFDVTVESQQPSTAICALVFINIQFEHISFVRTWKIFYMASNLKNFTSLILFLYYNKFLCVVYDGNFFY